MPDARLTAEGVVLREGAAPIDETVRPGEIVGLAGLDGHGQQNFLEVMAGLTTPVRGRVVAEEGRPLAGFHDAVKRGIAYLPRDRRTTGIFPTLSILDNFAIASIERDCRSWFIGRRARRDRYEVWQKRLGIVAPHPSAPITALSGGNQQKVLLARWLAREPKVLLLNDPTRGVDLGTRLTLYDVFRDLAREGLSLVVLSTEIEEIMHLCDRVLVFRERAVSARLSGEAMTTDATIAAMFGRAAA
jgi:ribose transport system ATP-binding protein